MKKRLALVLLLAAILALSHATALAQTYSFSLDRESVDVYWNDDGTIALDYVFVFSNDGFASPIEYVDVGLPNGNFSTGSMSAEVDGAPVEVSRSDYEGSGTGVAVVLGSRAIPPGRTGTVRLFIGEVRDVLRPDSGSNDYASGVFSPTWFGSQYVHGSTDMRVTFHLPPGVGPDEPRWHTAPNGWPSQPRTGFDDQDRITYTWENPNANGHTQYLFGASFPTQYVPASAVVRPSLLERLGISEDALIGFTICCGIGGFMFMSIFLSARASQRRKMQYLPPKIAIEGHGIKRGLTSIEAAILMEQPLDKVMTMILFAVVKKGAAVVKKRDPLELEVSDDLPTNLRQYELDFLAAFDGTSKSKRRTMLQDMTIALVKSISTKMKGFSRKETIAYYKDIMERAWKQVEAADTPEVKSQKYDEVMEWTMLDRDYDDRTRRTFHGGPVFVPIWWNRYDPGFPRTTSAGPAAAPVPAPSGGGGGISLPHLPGSDFAASMVNSVQDFSGNVIGNINDFTGKVTNKTNPVPVVKSSGSSRSGGGGCACACACAGCACACAGGGR